MGEPGELLVDDLQGAAFRRLIRARVAIGPQLAKTPRTIGARLDARIADLQEMRRGLDDFERRHAEDLTAEASPTFLAMDPRFREASP
jgi:hypothetical protein